MAKPPQQPRQQAPRVPSKLPGEVMKSRINMDSAPIVRDFKVGDLIRPKNSANVSNVVLLTEKGTSSDEFHYVQFRDRGINTGIKDRAHRFTTSDWELFQGELILSN